MTLLRGCWLVCGACADAGAADVALSRALFRMPFIPPLRPPQHAHCPMARSLLCVLLLLGAAAGAPAPITSDYADIPDVLKAASPPPAAASNATTPAPTANAAATPSPAAVPPPKAASPPPPKPFAAIKPKPVSWENIGPGRNAATWLRVAPLLNMTRLVIDAAGLAPKTNDNELVATLFFPTDAAWADFLEAAHLSPAQLLANKILVTNLARNHIVPHVSLRTIDFESGGKLATLGQEVLTLRPTADQFVVVSARATVTITLPDLQANNATLHVVDGVLVPDSVRVTVV